MEPGNKAIAMNELSISVLYFHDNDLILSEVQHMVVSLQCLQFTVLILSIESSDVFTRAAPLPRAPDYQRVVEVIVVRYLDGLRLWCACACGCGCVCVCVCVHVYVCECVCGGRGGCRNDSMRIFLRSGFCRAEHFMETIP